MFRKSGRTASKTYPEEYGKRMAELYETETESMRGKASHQGERIRSGSMEMVKEHPLLAGLAAFSLGVLAGLLIPETVSEDRVMGEKKEALKEKARRVGEETLEQAKESAAEAYKETKRAAMEEAEKEGLVRPKSEPASPSPTEPLE
jgi:ElaB/YqjD/DUF883 family membrane-anchored ribosome-binding protein